MAEIFSKKDMINDPAYRTKTMKQQLEKNAKKSSGADTESYVGSRAK
jgi:hypothetical protein